MMGTGQTALSIDAVLAGSDGLYWIVTYGFGLFCYNPVDETLVNYTNQPDPSSLASNYLLSITEDAWEIYGLEVSMPELYGW